jgi:hypothetical protein
VERAYCDGGVLEMLLAVDQEMKVEKTEALGKVYDYEVYINTCFNDWSSVVRDPFLFHGAD